MALKRANECPIKTNDKSFDVQIKHIEALVITVEESEEMRR